MADIISKVEKPGGLNKQVAEKSVKYLKDNLTKRRQQHVEDTARWNKDHPGVPPGNSVRRGASFKNYSAQRCGNEAFRAGYEVVDWSVAIDDDVNSQHVRRVPYAGGSRTIYSDRGGRSSAQKG